MWRTGLPIESNNRGLDLIRDGALPAYKHAPYRTIRGIAEAYTYGKGDGSYFYELSDLPDEVSILRPFLDRSLERCKTNDEKVRAVSVFVSEFAMRSFEHKMPQLCNAIPSSLSEETEAYYYAMPAKFRERLFDFNSGEEPTQKNVSIAVCVDASAQFPAKGRIEVTWKNSCRVDDCSPIYKGSSIAALALNNMVSRISGYVDALRAAFEGYLDLTIIRHYIQNSQYIFASQNGRDALNENITVIGTRGDLDTLQETLKHVGIDVTLDSNNSFVIADEAYEEAANGTLLRQMSGMGGDSKADYGCLMYLAWLCSQGFYFSTWRGFSSMRDWMRVVGKDNVAANMKDCDVYAVLSLEDGDTVLVTSYGFLALREGTLEKPEVVEWLSLDGVKTLYGVEDMTEKFKEEVKRFANDVDSYSSHYGGISYRDHFCVGSGKKQEGVSRIIHRACHCYRYCFRLPMEHYRDRWMTTRFDVDSDRTDWFLNIIGAKLSTKSFAATSYEYESGEASEQNKTFEAALGDVMATIRGLCSKAKKIQVYATPFVMKEGSPVVYDLDDVDGKPSCVVLPFNTENPKERLQW